MQWFSILATHWDHQGRFKEYWSQGATPRESDLIDLGMGFGHQDFENLPRQFWRAARVENHCVREPFSQRISLVVQSRLIKMWSSGDKAKPVTKGVCQSSCPFSRISTDPQQLSSLVIACHRPPMNQRPGGPAYISNSHLPAFLMALQQCWALTGCLVNLC